MEPDYIKRYILASQKEAKEASLKRRKIWRELWELYQSQQDYSGKADWQSKIFIPKIFMTVEQAASIVKRAVIHINRLFSIEAKDVKDDEQVRQAEEADKVLKECLEETNFTNTYGEMIKSAFLLGLGVIKSQWNEDKIEYQNIDIFNFYCDPNFQPFSYGRAAYMIEYKEMDLASLKEAAKDNKYFKKKEIDKIKEEYTAEEKEKARQRRGLSDYRHPFRKKVGLLEFYGDIISEDGEKVLHNQLIVLANEKHIIRHQDNPDDEYPYQLTIPVCYPHRGIAGVSLVEHAVRAQYTYNNILNMLVDNLNFTVNKSYIGQYSQILNPESVESIYPGKIVWGEGDARGMLDEIRTTNIGNDVFNTMEIISSEIEKATGVTELLMGTTQTGSKTATEVELKTSQAKGLFDIIAKDLEENSIKPLIKRAVTLLDKLGDEEIGTDYRYKVGGVSLILDEKRQVEKITSVLGLIGKNRELAQKIDIEELIKRFLVSLDMESVIKEEDEIPEAQPAGMPGRPDLRQIQEEGRRAGAEAVRSQQQPVTPIQEEGRRAGAEAVRAQLMQQLERG